MSWRRRARVLAAALGSGAVLIGTPATSGPADVLAARGVCRGEVCRFSATVRHDDSGWDHYANRFEVVAPDGRVLVTRVLRHPHVKEQPFSRVSGDVEVSLGIERVRVRAGDLVHGLGGAEVEVVLERRAHQVEDGEP